MYDEYVLVGKKYSKIFLYLENFSFFDLTNIFSICYSYSYFNRRTCPHRLVRSRIRRFHRCDTGSNPVEGTIQGSDYRLLPE